ncbi:hypothetical protein [Lacticaseibacillus rhamnosus]|uniref:hypothetical protein n=1 Tax=Lacticaseibacillus rhamnosus TaxID=47715 RepID=UPI0023E23A3A|nr:hypothetical protein [Lacticaseibacillus rhamnosus]MDF3335303.1 hypothetical protein [Lacticaseibacillus rhamnosus]
MTYKRLQIYADEALYLAIKKDARNQGVSINRLTADLLKRHYGLIPETAISETELTKIVLNEIESYIANLKPGDTFDLGSASETFRHIKMSYQGKPAVVRAKIGRSFANALSTRFTNVTALRQANGNVKKNANNATIYVIKS